MPLTVPEFGLQVAPPHRHGLRTTLHLSRDWRCYSERQSRGSECEWELRNATYIPPLKAIAPAGYVRPQSMEDWFISAGEVNKWRTGTPDWGRDATSYAFVDNRIYSNQDAAAGQIASDVALDGLVPRIAVWLERKPPPINQSVFVGVMVNLPALYLVEGVEQPARLTLTLPLMQSSDDPDYQWDEPFLHLALESEIGAGYYAGGSGYSFATSGRILSRGPQSSAMRYGAGREGWLIEYEEDADLYSGGHLLIRNVSEDGDDYWHEYNRRLRLVSTDEAVAAGAMWADGAWVVQVQGAQTIVNVTPIRYGDNDAAAWPTEAKPLPDENADNDLEAGAYPDGTAAQWGALATEPTDWSVTVAGHSDGTQRPQVVFARGTGSDNERAVLWIATEDNPATIGDADSSTPEDTNTPGVHRLLNVRYTWERDWKHCGGEATFATETAAYYDDWRENNDVVLSLGWCDGAGEDLETAEVAHGYILPGGLPRGRDGDVLHGDPTLGPVRFGGFDVARLPQKGIVDVRQAGGMAVEEWAELAANALGIDAERVYVAPAVASTTIPPHEIPSLPASAPRDGGSWESHISEVERAADVRVCWNRTLDYDLWVDGGAPEYEHGVSEIALQIDYQALADEDKLLRIAHDATGADYRNVLKAVGGPHEAPVEYYYAQDLADRKAGIGDDWPAALVADDVEIAELRAEFDREHGEDAASRLAWVMPMRPELRPDMFVQVDNCPGVGVMAGSVYRILSHAIETASGENWATSTIEALRVYEPSGPYGY